MPCMGASENWASSGLVCTSSAVGFPVSVVYRLLPVLQKAARLIFVTCGSFIFCLLPRVPCGLFPKRKVVHAITLQISNLGN